MACPLTEMFDEHSNPTRWEIRLPDPLKKFQYTAQVFLSEHVLKKTEKT